LFPDGKFVSNDKVIPFGVGKRLCLGQSLAEKEFFIFMTSLLQRFDFRHDPGSTLPSYIDIRHPISLLRTPPSFKVILQNRF
jgi:cytochrome P450